MAKKKTRKEKEKALYRLQAAWLKNEERLEEKEREEFEYLDARYIKRDLLKTVVYSMLILGLIFGAKWLMAYGV